MASGVLCTFSSVSRHLDGQPSQWFVNVSKDQRIKAWSTTTQGSPILLTEAKHLGNIYTSVSIVTPPASEVCP